jgi:hypothetical protein
VYRAYFSVRGSDDVLPLEKGHWPFKEFATLDEAVLWARRVAKRGTSVIAIDGDDGTRLSKTELAPFVR